MFPVDSGSPDAIMTDTLANKARTRDGLWILRDRSRPFAIEEYKLNWCSCEGYTATVCESCLQGELRKQDARISSVTSNARRVAGQRKSVKKSKMDTFLTFPAITQINTDR